MQETEQKLKDVTVEMHEVDADGNIASEIAVDGDGNRAGSGKIRITMAFWTAVKRARAAFLSLWNSIAMMLP